jgi:hypothetical protein
MAVFADPDRVALYAHLRSFESDFDKSQSQMRAISSAWSAAVLAAIALVITTAATPLVIPKDATLMPGGIVETRTEIFAYLRAIICFVGSAGVFAFWYVDQGVYQRLLHSVFAYGLFIESKDEKLPQVRSSMFLANLDVTNRLGAFYRAQFWLFAVLSLLIALLGLVITHNPAGGGVWLIVGIHLLAVIACEIISFHKWPSLENTLLDFYPDLAQKLPSRRLPAQKLRKAFNLLACDTGQRAPQPDAAAKAIASVRTSKFDGLTDPNLTEFLKRIRHG